ncbi:MAG: hypothetical protein R6V76_00225 [Desulfobacterales bacterium]
MKVVNFNVLVRLACFALILIFVGCSTSIDSDYANLDGTWQNPLNNQKVIIKISGDHKTITIGDKTLPVSIKKVDVDIFTVHVSDKTLGEKDWSLWRVWDDIGKSFTIKLEHDGTVDSLTHIA